LVLRRFCVSEATNTFSSWNGAPTRLNHGPENGLDTFLVKDRKPAPPAEHALKGINTSRNHTAGDALISSAGLSGTIHIHRLAFSAG
jgi:hypothetical protein